MSQAKDRRLGAVAPPPAKPGGEIPPSPPKAAVAVVLATVVVAVGAFWFFLEQHRPAWGWGLLGAGLIALYLENRYLPGLRERRALRRARRDGRRLLRSVSKALRKQGGGLGSEAKGRLEESMEAVKKALGSEDLAALDFALTRLDEAADAHLVRKSPTREYVEQVGGAILAALFLRAFAYEAFRIPSSSMVPTLLVGDHLFVNKFVYGLRIPFTTTKLFAGVPDRGDIVVFTRPGEGDKDDIIKRVVGLPGDRIEVRDRRITVNGEPVETEELGTVRLNKSGDSEEVTEKGPFMAFELFEERLGRDPHVAMALTGYPQSEVYGTEGVWVVQPDHVFVMGDNRDNSQDSRFGFRQGGFGQVPVDHIKGRADVIWLSIGGPHGLRFARMFTLIR